METSVKITLIIVAGVLILAGALGLGMWALVNPADQITTTGESNLKAVPDVISVYFNVETNGLTAVEAKDNNSEIVDSVITNLVKLGLERKDIVTENFNIYEDIRWENGRQKSYGYKATHSLRVQLSTDSTDKIGPVIDAGVDGGAMISYINFELSQEKENTYKAQALKDASEDARIKAESMAAGLGKKVVDIKSISDSSFNYSPWRLYDNVAMARGGAEAKVATTNIQPGEKDVNARVTVVFTID
jgi:uncharacterized protein YggE